MVRRKTTLRSKSGGYGAQNGNGNGNPRALVDEIVYREHHHFIRTGGLYGDPQYSGWTNASRPRDFAISLRPLLGGGGG
jgi:hypothetical protein